ncbi:hypothetical protein AB4Z54_39615, partial [Streptomyces sp. MCAF7]
MFDKLSTYARLKTPPRSLLSGLAHCAAPAWRRNPKCSGRAGSGPHTFGSMVDAAFGHPRLAAIYD